MLPRNDLEPMTKSSMPKRNRLRDPLSFPRPFVQSELTPLIEAPMLPRNDLEPTAKSSRPPVKESRNMPNLLFAPSNQSRKPPKKPFRESPSMLKRVPAPRVTLEAPLPDALLPSDVVIGVGGPIPVTFVFSGGTHRTPPPPDVVIGGPILVTFVFPVTFVFLGGGTIAGVFGALIVLGSRVPFTPVLLLIAAPNCFVTASLPMPIMPVIPWAIAMPMPCTAAGRTTAKAAKMYPSNGMSLPTSCRSFTIDPNKSLKMFVMAFGPPAFSKADFMPSNNLFDPLSLPEINPVTRATSVRTVPIMVPMKLPIFSATLEFMNLSIMPRSI